MDIQFISDKKGKKKSVIISMKDFNKINEDLEEFDLIREYDKSKSEKLTYRPLADALKKIESKRTGKK